MLSHPPFRQHLMPALGAALVSSHSMDAQCLRTPLESWQDRGDRLRHSSQCRQKLGTHVGKDHCAHVVVAPRPAQTVPVPPWNRRLSSFAYFRVATIAARRRFFLLPSALYGHSNPFCFIRLWCPS